MPRVSQTSPAHERRTLFLGGSVVHRPSALRPELEVLTWDVFGVFVTSPKLGLQHSRGLKGVA